MQKFNAYFEASEEDRKEFLRVLSHFIRITEEYLCKRAWKLAVNESIRKSQSINFAPMQGGCPLCGK